MVLSADRQSNARIHISFDFFHRFITPSLFVFTLQLQLMLIFLHLLQGANRVVAKLQKAKLHKAKLLSCTKLSCRTRAARKVARQFYSCSKLFQNFSSRKILQNWEVDNLTWKSVKTKKKIAPTQGAAKSMYLLIYHEG